MITNDPQRSILVHYFFMIFIYDIHNTRAKFHTVLFADDTDLITTLFIFNVNIDNNAKQNNDNCSYPIIYKGGSRILS